MSNNKIFDVKEFIRNVCEISPQITSKEISDFLGKKGLVVSWQSCAAIKSNVTRKMNS